MIPVEHLIASPFSHAGVFRFKKFGIQRVYHFEIARRLKGDASVNAFEDDVRNLIFRFLRRAQNERSYKADSLYCERLLYIYAAYQNACFARLKSINAGHLLVAVSRPALASPSQ
jgi:hypothetical protein